MNLVDRPDHLQYNEVGAFDKRIYCIFPYHDPVVANGHKIPRRDRAPSLAQLVHQCAFIDFLKEHGSQCMEPREGAADDSFGQEVDPPARLSVSVFRGSISLAYCPTTFPMC
jgi:hypothetical protein